MLKSCSPSAVWRRITRRSGVGCNDTVPNWNNGCGVILSRPTDDGRIDRQRGVSFRQEKDRGRQAEGCTCLEDQEGRRSATAVIASKAEWREVDLPVLRQRRPRSVVQEEAGRALPRL